MNQNPTETDITEAILESTGYPSARFPYAEGSTQRGGGCDDSTGSWRENLANGWNLAERLPLYDDPDLYRHTQDVRDWPRQNLEEMRHRD